MIVRENRPTPLEKMWKMQLLEPIDQNHCELFWELFLGKKSTRNDVSNYEKMISKEKYNEISSSNASSSNGSTLC